MVLRFALFGLCLVAQLGFWWQSNDWRPDRRVLPPAPSQAVADAMALGDPQFLYRAWTQQLENAGDTGGRVTPLRLYDYEAVARWLDTLDSLDRHSQYAVGLASIYFGFTDVPAQSREIVNYVRRHVVGQEEDKWFWLARAQNHAREVVQDSELALLVALQIDESADLVEPWARTLLPQALRNLGRYDEAADAMQTVLDRFGPESRPEEVNFMREFIAQMRSLQPLQDN